MSYRRHEMVTFLLNSQQLGLRTVAGVIQDATALINFIDEEKDPEKGKDVDCDYRHAPDLRKIAVACYEANRKHQEYAGLPIDPPAHMAEEHVLQPAFNMVSVIKDALAGDTPLTAQELHAALIEEMAAEGWEYAEADQPHLKRSRALLPWEDLPLPLKAEAEIYYVVTRAML